MDGYPLCSDYIPHLNLYAVASTDLQISFFTDDASMRRKEDLCVFFPFFLAINPPSLSACPLSLPHPLPVTSLQYSLRILLQSPS